MKTQFVESILDIPYDEWQPEALPEHRGKISYIFDAQENKSLMVILPCGHVTSLFGWTITDIDTDTPSATPSIFCHHNQQPCWHGYLTKGELLSV